MNVLLPLFTFLFKLKQGKQLNLTLNKTEQISNLCSVGIILMQTATVVNIPATLQ